MGIDYDLTLLLRPIARFLIPLGLLSRATDFTNVQYENSDGVTLHAYLATPSDLDETAEYPAAIVLHAWNGMSREPVYFSDLLAEQGFIAFAPDLFRNIAADNLNVPWNILTSLLTPQDRMDEDVDSAIDYLTNQVENVDLSRIFSGPGFCFGGSQSVVLSTRRAVVATVTLYGGNIDDYQNPDNDDRWGLLGVDGTPVLGIYGNDDIRPTPKQARGFRDAMDDRNITNTVTIYDDVGHAFVNPEDHEDGKTQAVEAWNQIVDFMNDVKNGTGVSRRAIEMGVLPRNFSNVPSFAWIFDHAMDWFQGKGHFSHRHNQNKKHGMYHADVATSRTALSAAHVHRHEARSESPMDKN